MGKSVSIIVVLALVVMSGIECSKEKSTDPEETEGAYSIPLASSFEKSFDFSKRELVKDLGGDIAAVFSSSLEEVIIDALSPARIRDMGTSDFYERLDFDPEDPNRIVASIGRYYAVKTKEGDYAKFYIVEATIDEMVMDWWYPI